MSRAFVKERDDEPVAAFPEPDAPHAVTVAGLRRLRERAHRAVTEAERSALQRRIAAAEVAEPPADAKVVAFGATVTVRTPDKTERVFTISGEDDVDIAHGRVGPDSPLARALIGRRAGERVLWERPAGDASLTIVAVDYGEFV